MVILPIVVVIAVIVVFVIFFSLKQGVVPPNGGILPGPRQSTCGTRREA